MDDKKLPTPQEYEQVSEDFAKSLLHLQEMGLVKIVNDKGGSKVTKLGINVMGAFEKLDAYNEANAK